MIKMNCLNNTLFAALAVLLGLLSGCSKEDDQNSGVQNLVTYNGNTYATPIGISHIYESGQKSDGTSLYAARIELTNYDDQTLMQEPSQVQVVHFVFQKMDQAELLPGTYHREPIGSDINNSWFQFNMKPYEGYRGNQVFFDTGKVDVVKDGDVYTFTYEFMTADGKKAAGFFTGKLVMR